MDDRLSPIEAVMWKAGQDPTLRMTVGIILALDHAPSYDALVERFDAVIKSAPRLRARPGGPSFGHACPPWIEDDAPDAEQHVRTAAVSRPGSLRQVLDLVGWLESIPFDPDRAPWDATLIEGLAGGRAALYLRAHHVVTDGLAGLRLAGRFLDGAEIDLREEQEPENGRRSGVATIDLTRDLDLTRALRPLQVAVNAARDPETVVRGLQGVLDLATSASRQVLIAGGSLSPLPGGHSMATRFEVISVPGARAAARTLGGSRNDLLVAGAAFGLGLYHDRLGYPCDELRVSIPTTQRRGHRVGANADAGGNTFIPARVTVPTTAASTNAHFDLVAERLNTARMEPAIRFADALASTISHVPGPMLVPAMRAQAGTVDFVATTIPGLHGSGRICGARIETSYPFGPRLGCPVNLTAFGNKDRLDVGVALDGAAIGEPEIFLECLDEAFATLIRQDR